MTLVLVGVFGYLALATQFATPPALVPGNRLLLATTDVPAVGAPPRRVGAPLISDGDAFWLAQPVKGEIVALRVAWPPDAQVTSCRVRPATLSPSGFETDGTCGPGQPIATRVSRWGPHGEPIDASRGLDRYLVSVEGDRLIVNLSRPLYGTDRTPTAPPK